METQLTHKHAVIFGAGGAIGSAVAREFAAQGATVFLSGRTLSAIEHVAQEIHQDGGVAYAAEVDALDEQAVLAYLDHVAQEGRSIDILLNATGPQPKDYGNGSNTLELPLSSSCCRSAPWSRRNSSRLALPHDIWYGSTQELSCLLQQASK